MSLGHFPPLLWKVKEELAQSRQLSHSKVRTKVTFLCFKVVLEFRKVGTIESDTRDHIHWGTGDARYYIVLEE